MYPLLIRRCRRRLARNVSEKVFAAAKVVEVPSSDAILCPNHAVAAQLIAAVSISATFIPKSLVPQTSFSKDLPLELQAKI